MRFDTGTKAHTGGGLMAITLRFRSDITPVQAFAVLFRTAAPHRFNGCLVFGHESSGERQGVCFVVRLASQDSAALATAGEVLRGASDFVAALSDPAIPLEPYLAQSPALATISGGEIRTAKGQPDWVRAGAELVKDSPRIVSGRPYPTVLCGRCGTETDGQTFCPTCGKQQKRLTKSAMGYLFFMLGFNLYQVFVQIVATGLTPSILQSRDPEVWMWLALTVFQVVALALAVVLLMRFRRLGFNILILLKLLDVFLYLVTAGVSAMTLLFALAAPFFFIIIAFSLLHKNLYDMK